MPSCRHCCWTRPSPSTTVSSTRRVSGASPSIIFHFEKGCSDLHIQPSCSLQVKPQVICFSFLVVLLSVLLSNPVLLYLPGLSLAAHGWRWQQAALFAGDRAGACAAGAGGGGCGA